MQFNRLIKAAGPFRKPVREFILEKRLSFPKLISLEVTNACNAKCVMCPREQLTRKIGNIRMDVVDKLCRDAYNKPLQKINVFGFGESLLHPQLVDIIRHIKDALPHVELNLSTNAQLLNGGLAQKLLASGIDRINVDIDGVQKQTFESVRRQLDFETVVNNVKNLIKEHDAAGSRVKLSVTIIKMDATEPEIESFRQQWLPLVDTVNVNHYNTWTGIFPDRNTNAPGLATFAFPCKNPWREMIVNYDGSVAFCCMDFNATIVIGNIMKNTIEEIWHSEEMNRLRSLHLEGRYKEIPICSTCNEFIFQQDTFWANLFYK